MVSEPKAKTEMTLGYIISFNTGVNTWQHMCSLDSPEFKDALLIARAKKGSKHTPEEHTILSHALKHEKALSGDDLFSAPKLSQSFANSNLRHLWHSSDSDRLPVPETLQSTSYSEPLPAGPNATACSFHSNLSPNTPSEGCSKTSASSKSNPKTSSDSTPSNPNSAPTFFGDSPSRSGDRVTPMASDIKGRVIKVICNVKGQWWSGSMGNARRWP